MSVLKYEVKNDYIEIKGEVLEENEVTRFLEIQEEMEAEVEGEVRKLPVKVIGNHAFSSRKDIYEIKLPDSINTILGFAFHNCSNLKKISLTDSVREFLDGSTRQCDSLEAVDVTFHRENYEIVRSILGDNDRRLTFYLHLKDDQEAILVFPGFNYDFVENTMARTIQFAIEGTGYAYRECVKSASINFREYDNMFSKASADDSVTAEMIAIARLSAPYELSEDAKSNYEEWLKKNSLSNLTRLLNEKNVRLSFLDDMEAVFDFYIQRKLINTEDAMKLTHVSSEKGMTSIVSILMDYSNDNTVINAESGELELDF